MRREGKTVLAAGCGNIGSYFVSHLGRMKEVKKVTLIDPDGYEIKNLKSQDIRSSDVGRAKAEVQAERLREINPGLEVESVVDKVQNVPLGKLRADVIAGCLDNNEARQYLNQSSWLLNGVPYIDAGVSPADMLMRVEIYAPGPAAPCLECSWSSEDYDLLEQRYPCRVAEPEDGPASTNGTSSLGAFAASIQAVECEKLLNGSSDKALIGRKVLIDAMNHKYHVVKMFPNASCRFDHHIRRVEKLNVDPAEFTLNQAYQLLMPERKSFNGNYIRFCGPVQFATRLVCPGCGSEKPLLRLRNRLNPEMITCASCGARLETLGFDLLDYLACTEIPPYFFQRSLDSLGFLKSDVFSISDLRTEQYYEL